MTPLTRARLATLLAALALLALPLIAHAQSAPPAASAALDVSPSQQARIQARQQQFQKDVAALRADSATPDAQKRAKYAALVQAMNKDILALLTPAQRAQEMKRQKINLQFQKDVAALQADRTMTDAQKKARYTALVQAADTQTLATLTPTQRTQALRQRQAGLARQKANQARVADATRLGKQLQASLSPDQEKQIHAIGLASGAQIQGIIADKSVPQQAKVTKITALREQAQAKINAILTPTQRAQYARIQALVSAPPPQ